MTPGPTPAGQPMPSAGEVAGERTAVPITGELRLLR